MEIIAPAMASMLWLNKLLMTMLIMNNKHGLIDPGFSAPAVVNPVFDVPFNLAPELCSLPALPVCGLDEAPILLPGPPPTVTVTLTVAATPTSSFPNPAEPALKPESQGISVAFNDLFNSTEPYSEVAAKAKTLSLARALAETVVEKAFFLVDPFARYFSNPEEEKAPLLHFLSPWQVVVLVILTTWMFLCFILRLGRWLKRQPRNPFLFLWVVCCSACFYLFSVHGTENRPETVDIEARFKAMFKDHLEEFNKKIDGLERRLLKQDTKIGLLRSECDTKDGTIKDTAGKLKATEEKYAGLSRKADEARMAHKREVSSLEEKHGREITSLERQHATALAGTQTGRNATNSRLEQTKHENSQLYVSLQKKEEYIKELHQKDTRKQKDLDEAKAAAEEAKNLRDEVEHLKQQRTKSAGDFTKLKDQLGQEKKLNGEHAAAILRYVEKEKAHGHEILRMKQENSDLRQSRNVAVKAQKSAEGQINAGADAGQRLMEIVVEKKQLEDQCQAASDEKNAAIRDRDAAIRDRDAAILERDTAVQEKKTAVQAESAALQQSSRLINDKKKVLSSNSALSRQLASVTTERDEAKASFKASESEKASLSGQKNALEVDLDRAREDLSEAISDKESAWLDRTSLEGDLEETKAECERLRAEKKVTNVENAKLKRRLNLITPLYEDLKARSAVENAPTASMGATEAGGAYERELFMDSPTCANDASESSSASMSKEGQVPLVYTQKLSLIPKTLLPGGISVIGLPETVIRGTSKSVIIIENDPRRYERWLQEEGRAYSRGSFKSRRDYDNQLRSNSLENLGLERSQNASVRLAKERISEPIEHFVGSRRRRSIGCHEYDADLLALNSTPHIPRRGLNAQPQLQSAWASDNILNEINAQASQQPGPGTHLASRVPAQVLREIPDMASHKLTEEFFKIAPVGDELRTVDANDSIFATSPIADVLDIFDSRASMRDAAYAEELISSSGLGYDAYRSLWSQEKEVRVEGNVKKMQFRLDARLDLEASTPFNYSVEATEELLNAVSNVTPAQAISMALNNYHSDGVAAAADDDDETEDEDVEGHAIEEILEESGSGDVYADKLTVAATDGERTEDQDASADDEVDLEESEGSEEVWEEDDSDEDTDDDDDDDEPASTSTLLMLGNHKVEKPGSADTSTPMLGKYFVEKPSAAGSSTPMLGSYKVEKPGPVKSSGPMLGNYADETPDSAGSSAVMLGNHTVREPSSSNKATLAGEDDEWNNTDGENVESVDRDDDDDDDDATIAAPTTMPQPVLGNWPVRAPSTVVDNRPNIVYEVPKPKFASTGLDARAEMFKSKHAPPEDESAQVSKPVVTSVQSESPKSKDQSQSASEAAVPKTAPVAAPANNASPASSERVPGHIFYAPQKPKFAGKQGEAAAADLKASKWAPKKTEEAASQSSSRAPQLQSRPPAAAATPALSRAAVTGMMASRYANEPPSQAAARGMMGSRYANEPPSHAAPAGPRGSQVSGGSGCGAPANAPSAPRGNDRGRGRDRGVDRGRGRGGRGRGRGGQW